jgi:hypothetical protein
MRALPRIMLVVLSLAAAACASGRRGDTAIAPRETAVEVNNQAWMDMTVYILDGSRRVRLGTATSLRSVTFRIPDSVIGLGRTVSFQVDPVGSNNVASSFEMHVTPGQTVRLTIPPRAGR